MLKGQLQIDLVSTNDEQITIAFNHPWYQEDIDILSQLVFSKTTQYKIKEKVLGADRENIRFAWQQHEFLLNFDCYSQSCWVSANDQNSQALIPQLSQLLTQSTENHIG